MELLLLVFTIAILAAMLFPAPKHMNRAKSVMCLSNTKQLALASALYAEDNHDFVPLNYPSSPAGCWVLGNESMSGTNDANTNTADLAGGSIYVYVRKQLFCYHCPADISAAPGQSPRLRSYSLNAFVGGVPFPGTTRYHNFIRQRDFQHPSTTYTFLDEHPDSINDGCFLPILSADITDTTEWGDLAASYHQQGGNFAFADGHSEAHRWLVNTTRKSITGTYAPFAASPASDLQWLIQHMSPPN